MSEKQPQTIIKDFDKVIRPTRIAVLAGKELDVSTIPTRVTMELLEFMKRGSISDPSNFTAVIDMVAKISRDPEVTVDWLYDNTDLDTLVDLLTFIMEPLSKKADEAMGKGASEEPKN